MQESRVELDLGHLAHGLVAHGQRTRGELDEELRIRMLEMPVVLQKPRSARARRIRVLVAGRFTMKSKSYDWYRLVV